MALASRTQGALALTTLIGISLFVALVVALHGLEPSVAGLSHTMSEFALGTYGILMVIAFLAAGLGSLALAAILIRGSNHGNARVGGILIAIWGIGLLVSAFVPTDPYGTTDATATSSGNIHNLVGGLSFVACGAGLVTLGFRSRRWGNVWRGRGQVLLACGAIGLAAVVTLFLPVEIPEGALQRVMVAAFVVGLLLAAIWLRSDAGGRSTPSAA